MKMELRTAYWDDRESREAFQRFILDIHNLDFNAWEEAGYWDDAYRPFSWFQDGEVISSVCIYSLPAVIDGRTTKLAQISGVGTLPEYRRCGLNRELTAAGLQWAGTSHEGVFLFSDEDAVPYYEHCGFKPSRCYDVPERSG
jgi:GNAT superfamily N-acetyltransferase